MSVYFLPSLQLSSVIESETNSILYYYIQIDSIIRSLFALKSPLHYSLSSPSTTTTSPYPDQEVFSGNTLRILDNLLLAHQVAGARLSSLTRIIGVRHGMTRGGERRRLRGAIGRVLYSYKMTGRLLERAETTFIPTPITSLVDVSAAPSTSTLTATSTNDETEGDEILLRRLWKAYRPAEEELGAGELRYSRRWQELGFQGKDPTTDFRRTGMLTIDTMLYFAETFAPEQVTQILAESVDGGMHWYPLALASIHVAQFVVTLAKQRDLQLLLLRSLQVDPFASTDDLTQPSISIPSIFPDRAEDDEEMALLDDVDSEDEGTDPATEKPIDLTPFCRIHSELLMLFHQHWLKEEYTVMQFEEVFKKFKADLTVWIRRGVIDGRALGWSTSSGGIKLE